MKTFNPPIASRTTNELVKIVAAPEDWDAEAVAQAEAELLKREVKYEDLAKREKYLNDRKEKLETLRRAKESYSMWEFLDSPVYFVLEILGAWNLAKEGYLRKARQQKRFRIITLGIGIIIYLYVFINNL